MLLPNFDYNGKVINAGLVTTFSEYSIVSENRITLMPADLDFAEAALYGCAITTGFGVVRNDAEVQMGDNVVIFGAGGIGLNIIQACYLLSASRIIALDLFDIRLDLAQALGATHTINSSSMKPILLKSQIENSRSKVLMCLLTTLEILKLLNLAINWLKGTERLYWLECLMRMKI